MSEKQLQEMVPGYAALPASNCDAIKRFACLKSLLA